jgi:hypothetical protein
MITISQYHPVTPEHTNQVGMAQLQEKQDERKKITIQDSKESEKLRFEKEQDKQEKQKKKRKSQREEAQVPGEENAQPSPKRLLDVTV